MPKYDAFGREIGEDSLEGLGWTSGGAIPPASEPAAAPPPPPPRQEPPPVTVNAPPQPTATAPPLSIGDPLPPSPSPAPAMPRTPRRRRPSRGARMMSRLITLVIFCVIAANVLPGLFDNVKDATDGIKVNIPDIPEPSVPKVEKPPVGLAAGSLIRKDAFAKSLADLRRRNLGKLTNLRLAPERIDVQTLKRGRLANSQLSTADGFRKFSESGPGFTGASTIPWGKLDPAAPQRLVRAAAERIHKPVAKIDYLVPSEFDGAILWGAYFKGGQIVQGDAHGKVTRRIS